MLELEECERHNKNSPFVISEVSVTTLMDHFYNETLDHPMKFLLAKLFLSLTLMKMVLAKDFIAQNFENWDFTKFTETSNRERCVYAKLQILANSRKGWRRRAIRQLLLKVSM